MKFSAVAVLLAGAPVALAGSNAAPAQASVPSTISAQAGVDHEGKTTGHMNFESAINADVKMGLRYNAADRQRVESIFAEFNNQATPFGTSSDTRVNLDPEDNSLNAVVNVNKDDRQATLRLKSERSPMLESVEFSVPVEMQGMKATLKPFFNVPSGDGHLRAETTLADTDVAVKVSRDGAPAEVALKRRFDSGMTVKVSGTPQDMNGEVDLEQEVNDDMTVFTKVARAAGAAPRWVSSGFKTKFGERRHEADVNFDAEHVRVRATTSINGKDWVINTNTPLKEPKKSSVSFGRDFEF